jgi:hypothetical protein
MQAIRVGFWMSEKPKTGETFSRATAWTRSMIVGLASAMCFFVVGSVAVADGGACGLVTGIWAAPKEACQYAGHPDLAAKQFGEDALLEWHRGYYRFQGATCTIFSDKLVAKQCTLRVECSYQKSYSMAEWTIEIETTQQVRFGAHPDSPMYYHCAADGIPR